MGLLTGRWFVVGPGREPTPEVTRRQLESRLTFGTEAEGRYELDDRGLRLYDPDNNLVAEFKTLDGSALITGTITNDESGQPRILIDPTKDAYRLINADDSEAGSFERLADADVALMVRDGGFIAFGSTINRMRYYNSGFLEFAEIVAPATPAANKLRIYPKDKAGTSALYIKNDAGTEYELGPIATHTHTESEITDFAHTHPEYALSELSALSSSDTAMVTSTWTDIADLSLSLNRNGLWMVIGTIHWDLNNVTADARLLYDGSAQTGQIRAATNATVLMVTTEKTWFVTVTGQPKTVKLQGFKDAGTGANTKATNSAIKAVWLRS